MAIYNNTKFLSLPQQVNKNKKDIEVLQEEVEINFNNYIPKTEKGQPLGVATLDENGKFISSQLPSYVDDVLEYTNISEFPANGESGKIYVTLDTNKTYRWSGSGYIEISASLVLGETSLTAGRGDWTKTAYDHTFLTNNPHGVTKSQIGLNNVDNTSDLDKPISTAQQTALNGKQNTLTAGDGISISGNVISAVGGSEITVESWDMPIKTLALSDSNKLFRCSWSSDQILTIPTNTTVAFPIGTMITFLLTGNYKVIFSGASGVTLTSMDGLVELATQYAMASLIKTDTNTWQLVGALE